MHPLAGSDVTIGAELKQAREQRGVSLRELSERTQIRVPVLRAIESDDFQRLPRGAIMRGFLKLYAREVELDPEEIANRYAQVEWPEPDRPGEAWPPVEPAPSGIRAGLLAVSLASTRARAIGGAAGMLALVVAGYLALRPTPSRPDAGDQRPAELTTPLNPSPASKPEGPQRGPAAPPQKTPATGAGDAAPVAPESSADVLRIDLHATGPVWVSATADGQQVMYRQMEPGERLAIRVTSEAVLRIGVPANLIVTLNDRPVRPFERPGNPITLRITPANYRDLLGAQPPR